MSAERPVNDHHASRDEAHRRSVPDLPLYVVDTSVDELCHLLARIVARAANDHTQDALQEQAA